MYTIRASMKVCGIKSATNIPGAIPFICLGFLIFLFLVE